MQRVLGSFRSRNIHCEETEEEILLREEIEKIQQKIELVKKKMVADQKYYEELTETSEMQRLQEQKEVESLEKKTYVELTQATEYFQWVTVGWAIGLIFGWTVGFLVTQTLANSMHYQAQDNALILGLLVVAPFMTLGIIGGVFFAKLNDRSHQKWRYQKACHKAVGGSEEEDDESEEAEAFSLLWRPQGGEAAVPAGETAAPPPRLVSLGSLASMLVPHSPASLFRGSWRLSHYGAKAATAAALAIPSALLNSVGATLLGFVSREKEKGQEAQAEDKKHNTGSNNTTNNNNN